MWNHRWAGYWNSSCPQSILQSLQSPSVYVQMLDKALRYGRVTFNNKIYHKHGRDDPGVVHWFSSVTPSIVNDELGPLYMVRGLKFFLVWSSKSLLSVPGSALCLHPLLSARPTCLTLQKPFWDYICKSNYWICCNLSFYFLPMGPLINSNSSVSVSNTEGSTQCSNAEHKS